jgi:hypothetical protein
MKKCKELNNFHNELILQFESIELIINDYKKKIKKEYQQLLIEEKNKLLLKVAEGEKLNVNNLKEKYLKAKEITTNEDITKQLVDKNEELLDKIIIEDQVYYYENKEKGKVFDIKNIEVGIFKNGSILLNYELIR